MTFRKHILTKDYRTSAAASEFAYHKLKQIKYPWAVICSLLWEHSLATSLCSWGGVSWVPDMAFARRTKFELAQAPPASSASGTADELPTADGHKLQIPPDMFLNSIGDVWGQKHRSKEWQIPNRVCMSPHHCLGLASIHFLCSYTEAQFDW